jgi:hypothetical protein
MCSDDLYDEKKKPIKRGQSCPHCFGHVLARSLLVFGLCDIVSNLSTFSLIVGFLFWLIVGLYYFGFCGIL